MKVVLSVCCLIFISTVVNAANQQISENKKITEVHTYVGGASFTYHPVSTSSYGCTGVGASYTVHIDWSTNEDYKAMFSSVLAAYTAGKTVGFGVSGCVSAYDGIIPKVYRVDVIN